MLKDAKELAEDGRNERIFDGIFLSETSQQLQLSHKGLDEAFLLLCVIETESKQVLPTHD